MQNIRNRVTIPVNFTARKSIKSEVAKALYNRVDSILAKSDRHEKTATNLVEELGLTKHRYQYKSQRKKFIELLQKNLDGVALSSVKAFLSVEIVETKNGKDWKCVFSKRVEQKKVDKRRLPIVNADAEYRDYLVDLIVDAV